MNDIKTLDDVEKVLKEQGFAPVRNEHSVALPVGGDAHPFPAKVFMDETYLMVVCQIDTWGNMLSRVPTDDREEFHLAIYDMNSQMNSYAVTVLSDIDGEGDDKDDWPVALINSIPVGDISEGELLEGIRGLQAALITIKSVFDVCLVPAE